MSIMNRPGLREFISEFKESKSGVLGAGLTLICFWAALLAPVISPQNPYDLSQLYLQNSYLPPTF